MVDGNAQPSKLSKSEVGFEHPAKGTDDCDDCIHFKPLREKCQIVAGHVEGEDWCERFKRKTWVSAGRK